MTNWVLIAITVSITLMLSLTTYSYAWHENLGIDDNKAAELYQTKPNDPAIVQWKNALQSAINGVDECFDIQTVMICDKSSVLTVISNCESHPNELLACNDARIAQYPMILKKAQEALSTKVPQYAENVIDMCFSNTNSNTTFKVAGLACDIEMRSLQSECQLANNTYNYCKDERYVGYLEQNNILNSTDLN